MMQARIPLSQYVAAKAERSRLESQKAALLGRVETIPAVYLERIEEDCERLRREIEDLRAAPVQERRVPPPRMSVEEREARLRAAFELDRRQREERERQAGGGG